MNYCGNWNILLRTRIFCYLMSQKSLDVLRSENGIRGVESLQTNDCILGVVLLGSIPFPVSLLHNISACAGNKLCLGRM